MIYGMKVIKKLRVGYYILLRIYELGVMLGVMSDNYILGAMVMDYRW